jgi:tetratricopeptide (TPR) repeat protein
MMFDSNRFHEGSRLLKQCLIAARKGRFWKEYVRALRGLADQSLRQGNHSFTAKAYRRTIRAALVHSINDHLFAARINYGWMLMQAKKPRDAIRQFEAAQPRFATDPNGSEYASYLAICYEETGAYAESRGAWEQSRVLAEAVGDQRMKLHADVQSAKVLAKLADYDAADHRLKRLWRISNGQNRIPIGRAAIELAASQANFRRASRWTALVSNESASVGHSEDEIDAYMVLGDALWAAHDSRAEGAKCYWVAQMFSFDLSAEAISRTGLHLVWKLLSVPQTSRDEYRSHIEQWLRSQREDGRSVHYPEFFFWPFCVAKQAGSLDGLPNSKAKKKLLTAVGSTLPKLMRSPRNSDLSCAGTH